MSKSLSHVGWRPGVVGSLGLAVLLVLGFLSQAGLALAVGSGSTLAWGSGAAGQLGDGGISDRLSPGASSSLTGVAATSAGADHTLALLADGTVRAWGRNDRGQLGNGARVDSAVPVAVTGLSGVTAISAGHRHNLALTAEGTVFSWGDGSSGQLGNGYPATVYPEESCTILLIFPCLDSSGTGPSELLPDEQMESLTAPRPVMTGTGPLRDVVAIAAGGAHSLAVKADGSVWAWGSNADGQLGAGVEAYFNGPILPLPIPVGANTSREDRLGGIVAVAAGGSHSLALAADGSLYAWGSNGAGQLGSNDDGTAGGFRVSPGQVPLAMVTSISAGQAHSLAVVNGLVWAWGDNSRGQLGDGTTEARTTPIHVPGVPSGGGFGGSNAISVAAGHFHSLALVDRAPYEVCPTPMGGFGCPGVVYSWGYGEAGQLGTGGRSDRALPQMVPALSEVSAVAGGFGHSVALDGQLASSLIFPVEPTPTIGVAPGRPTLPPFVQVPTRTPTPTPSSPFQPFATPAPTS